MREHPSPAYHFKKLIEMETMKKIEYIAPEMEEIKLKAQTSLLAGSGEEEIAPGTGDSEEL